MTRANIEQVHQLTEKYPHVSIQRVSTLLSISHGSALTIHHDHLNMAKVCAQWIPHQLHDEQKKQRMTSAQEIIDIFDGDCRGRLSDIVTVDEKWFNVFMMPNKWENWHWMSTNTRTGIGCQPIPADIGCQPIPVDTLFFTKRIFTVFFDSQGTVAV